MSVTGLLWLLLFLALCLLSLRAPSWGASVYMMTFFALPQLWWWGKSGPLASPRWNLIGGLIFLISVVLTYRPHPLAERLPRLRMMRLLMVLMVMNYTLVTLLLSINFEMSTEVLFLQLKFIMIVFLMDSAMQDEANFRRVIITMLCGLLFLGVETNLLGAGKYRRGRLEGVGVPGGNSSNQLANLLVTFLPMAGAAIFSKDKSVRVVGLITSPMALNTLLKCNSRGAFLGVLTGGAVMLLLARGKERRLLLGGALLGGLSLLVLIGDERILGRFQTTFAPQNEQDASAASRLVFWNAALKCLGDHPWGVGGDCYKKILSRTYLSGFAEQHRSIHNGWINEAVQWGVHALVMRVLLVYHALRCAISGQKMFRGLGVFDMSLMGLAFIGGLVAFSMSGFFGDYWDSEWGLQLCALCMGYYRIAMICQKQQADQQAIVPALVGSGPMWGPMWSPPMLGGARRSLPG
jgi:hypothetical protein